jgi:hypothetical protein
MVTAPPRLRVTASGRASMNCSASPTALPSPAAPDCRSPTGLGATARSNTANISPDSPLRHLAAKVSVRSCEPRVALSLSPRPLQLPRARSVPIDQSPRGFGMTMANWKSGMVIYIVRWCGRVVIKHARRRRAKDRDASTRLEGTRRTRHTRRCQSPAAARGQRARNG